MSDDISRFVHMATGRGGPRNTGGGLASEGTWLSPSGKQAEWRIAEGSLTVVDPDSGKIMALVPLDALVAALNMVGR